MAADTSNADDRAELLAVEAKITGFMGGIRRHHHEMQELDYDNDPSVLRKHLDVWLDWHLFASECLLKARQLQSEARVNLRLARQHANSPQAEFEMSQRLAYVGSADEREMYYQMKTDDEQRNVDVLDRIVATLIDFIRTLKTATEHWDKRRVDSKWETDRSDRTPGSDYARPDA